MLYVRVLDAAHWRFRIRMAAAFSLLKLLQTEPQAGGRHIQQIVIFIYIIFQGVSR